MSVMAARVNLGTIGVHYVEGELTPARGGRGGAAGLHGSVDRRWS
jgi:hypothetical protein